MKGLFLKTPLLESLELSEVLNAQVFLKMEAVQPSGSFKNRGIGYLCNHYAENEGAKVFISASGGNAGLAVAHSGRLLKVRVKVVMPTSSPKVMAEKILREEAEVIIHGEDISEAEDYAKRLANKPGYFFIPPFDHPLIWKGHSSLVHEIKGDGVRPDAIVVAVGGAGLFCGVVQGLRELGWDDTVVITAQTEGAAAFAKSVEAGKLVTLEKIETIATSLGAKRVTPQALEWAKIHPVEPHIISDKQTVNAILRFADDHRLLVEPACGAPLALVYDRLIDPKKFRKIVIVICGGCGVSRALLDKWTKAFELTS